MHCAVYSSLMYPKHIGLESGEGILIGKSFCMYIIFLFLIFIVGDLFFLFGMLV